MTISQTASRESLRRAGAASTRVLTKASLHLQSVSAAAMITGDPSARKGVRSTGPDAA